MQILLILALLLPAPATQCAALDIPATVEAEVEIHRGREVSRISVFVVNSGATPFEFDTGSRGGPGRSTDEPGKRGDMEIGTGMTALPTLEFEDGQGKSLVVRAPKYAGGITRRNMRPEMFVVGARERRRYYSFVVPSAHVAGKFLGGTIAVAGSEGIPIVRETMIRSSDHDAR